MYCDMSIVLSAQADKPNRNGVSYTEECLRKAFAPEKLTGLPITVEGKIIGKTGSEKGNIRVEFDRDGTMTAIIPVTVFGAAGTTESVTWEGKTILSATVTEISVGLEDET